LIFAVRPRNFAPAESFLKRIIDIIGASFLLTLTSPLLLLFLVLVPFTSPGPIFFRQERIGRHRRKFHIVKFRTMVPNAESLTGPVLASERDPRITRIGRILRASRLDELPQLWNVLLGDMSLVGPRPEREFFVHQYEKILPAYDLRHTVKPGITGLAQVKAGYSTSADRKLHFDLFYIYRYSVFLDLRILFQTIVVVLRGRQEVGIKDARPQLRPVRDGHSFRPAGHVIERISDRHENFPTSL
jgi:exopolysaccharide biosynthesis polyprenyl glycosylphosphotransferase